MSSASPPGTRARPCTARPLRPGLSPRRRETARREPRHRGGGRKSPRGPVAEPAGASVRAFDDAPRLARAARLLGLAARGAELRPRVPGEPPVTGLARGTGGLAVAAAGDAEARRRVPAEPRVTYGGVSKTTGLA